MKNYLQNIKLPNPTSHKGQNGKLLIIGGSELFHAASRWSLDVASKFVDMVFYASVPSNNDLITEAKGKFWNGIVIQREDLENYIDEADCILIGPGMTREKYVNDAWRTLLLSGQTWSQKKDVRQKDLTIQMRNKPQKLSEKTLQKLRAEINWSRDTYAVTNYLLAKYSHKKWVIDAGALQMVEPALLNQNVIITPHYGELKTVFENFDGIDHVMQMMHKKENTDATFEKNMLDNIRAMSGKVNGATFIIKGKRDIVCNAEQIEIVEGGNAGMTKGGTGDVLAGLVAALYCTNEIYPAAVVASYTNKKAGDALYKKVGPFFNASDLVAEIPTVLWEEIGKS